MVVEMINTGSLKGTNDYTHDEINSDSITKKETEKFSNVFKKLNNENSEDSGELKRNNDIASSTLVHGTIIDDPQINSVKELLVDVSDSEKSIGSLKALNDISQDHEYKELASIINETLNPEREFDFKIDAQTYASLMEKSRNFRSALMGFSEFASKIPDELTANFNLLSEQMELTSSEKNLLGKTISVAFNGARNIQEATEKLVHMLDMSEINNTSTMYKIYSNGPGHIKFNKEGADLTSRNNIAKLSMLSDENDPDSKDTMVFDKKALDSKFNSSAINQNRNFVKSQNAPHETNISFEEKTDRLKVNDDGPLSNFSKTANLSDVKNLEDPANKLQSQSVDLVKVENLIKEFSARINHIVKNNGGEMRMKLYPESLGELFVRIEAKNDNVTLKIITNSSEAKQILETNLPNLRASLGTQRLNLEKAEIDVNFGNMSSGNQNFDNSHYAFNSKESHSDGWQEKWNETNVLKARSLNGANGKGYSVSNSRYGNMHNYVA